MTANSPGVLALRLPESEPSATPAQEGRPVAPQVEAFEKAMQQANARHPGQPRPVRLMTGEYQVASRAPETKPRPRQKENGDGAPLALSPAALVLTVAQPGAATATDQKVMNASTPTTLQNQDWQEPPTETRGAASGAHEKMTPLTTGRPAKVNAGLDGKAAKESQPAESEEFSAQATAAGRFNGVKADALSANHVPAEVAGPLAGADGADQTTALPASGEWHLADGMPAAQGNQPMSRNDKMKEIADRGEQNLPLAFAAVSSSSSKGPAAAVDQGSDAFNYAAILEAEFALTDSPFMAVPTGAVAGSVAETEPVRDSTPLNEPVDLLERMSHLMIKEVSLLKRFDASSLAAVLRPDENTELFLRLTQDKGQMAAFVRCERGDFSQLSRHWGELQESLARQHVQLAPLQERMVHAHLPENSASLANGSATANSERHPQQPAPGMITPLGELEIPGSRTGPVQKTARKTPSPRARGWETWA
ncbi:MAG: hypothetical protein AAB676_08530 [Verrucomicrobiota bacterium]